MRSAFFLWAALAVFSLVVLVQPVEGIGCFSDIDCGTGTCVNNVCVADNPSEPDITPPVAEPECRFDSDCGYDYGCVVGSCRYDPPVPPTPVPECRVNSDCSYGEFCDGGGCREEPKVCTGGTGRVDFIDISCPAEALRDEFFTCELTGNWNGADHGHLTLCVDGLCKPNELGNVHYDGSGRIIEVFRAPDRTGSTTVSGRITLHDSCDETVVDVENTFASILLLGEQRELKPPVLFNPQPTGTIRSTSSTTISIKTDEPAVCEYSAYDFTYGSGTRFASTGGNVHSGPVSVVPGGDYRYYVICRDSDGLTNLYPGIIAFSVANEPSRLIVFAEDGDGRPVDANIIVSDGIDRFDRTGNDGRVGFPLPADVYSVEGRYQGRDLFATVFLDEGETEIVRFVFDGGLPPGPSGKGNLSLLVKCGSERREDVRILLEEVGSEDEYYEYSNDFGRAIFQDLRPGKYDIRVNDDGTPVVTLALTLREGANTKTVSVCDDIVVDPEQGNGTVDLLLKRMVHPQTVVPGERFSVELRIKNVGERKATGVRGEVVLFGQTKRSGFFTLFSDEERTVVLNFTAPLGSYGKRLVQGRAFNQDDEDYITAAIVLSKVRANLFLDPQVTTVGKTVRVYGQVRGYSLQDAELYFDGSRVDTVGIDGLGNYEGYLVADRPGAFTITVRNTEFVVSRILEVKPELFIRSFLVKTPVRTGEVFQACGVVESTKSGLVQVELKEGGNVLGSQEVVIVNERTVCFDTVLESPGEKNLEMTVGLDSLSDREYRQIEVLPGVRAVMVLPPGGIMVELGNSQLVKISLWNNDPDVKRFTATVTGIPEYWYSLPVSEAVVAQGEHKELFLYINPQETGDFHVNVTVTANGRVYEEDRAVYVSPQRRPFLDRFLLRFRSRLDVVFLILFIITLVVLALFLRKPRVMRRKYPILRPRSIVR